MNKENDRMLIFLSSFEFMNYNKEERLLSLFDEPKNLRSEFRTRKEDIIKIFDENTYLLMLSHLDDIYIDTFVRELLKKGIMVITRYSSYYPDKLRYISTSPFHLFVKGNLDLLNTKSVGIVGTRNPTIYGKSVTENFSKKLAQNELTIVSGLAYGVDSIAHKSCLTENGNTIAVLGCGINNIYPAQHFELAKTVSEKGLLISEYLPHVKAEYYFFPVRNRIIAALSDAVLITEAGLKSGVMHTKEYALDYGKEVYAVPGNINSKMSEGTNLLIRSHQAICATSPDQILEDLGIRYVISKKPKIRLSDNEKMIVEFLEDGEKHFEEILKVTKLDTKTLNSCLTTMQINEIIKKLDGNYYSIN